MQTNIIYDNLYLEKEIAKNSNREVRLIKEYGSGFLTPDEACDILNSIGANISRRTLLHYEDAELIPKPFRGSNGKKGRFTAYPEFVIEEAFAAWSMIHGKYGESVDENLEKLFEGMAPKLSPSAISKIRDNYYQFQGEKSIRTKYEWYQYYDELSRIEEAYLRKKDNFELSHTTEFNDCGVPEDLSLPDEDDSRLNEDENIDTSLSFEDYRNMYGTTLEQFGHEDKIYNTFKKIENRRIEGIKKINYGFQLLWEAECVRARFLLLNKKAVD